jgi:hypothetical protein
MTAPSSIPGSRPSEGAAAAIRRLIDGSIPKARRGNARRRARALPHLPKHQLERASRRSLRMLQRIAPLELHEVPERHPVFRLAGPARVDPAGERGSSGRTARSSSTTERLNLFTSYNYSAPFQRQGSARGAREAPLLAAGTALAGSPTATSYYREDWGFCLSHELRACLRPGDYEVLIDTSLTEGSLTFGELVLPGETSDTVPHLDSLLPSLARQRQTSRAWYWLPRWPASCAERPSITPTASSSYRGRIGSITWLALNEERARRIRHGLVVACVGDAGRPHLQAQPAWQREIDRGRGARPRPQRGRTTDPRLHAVWLRRAQYCSHRFRPSRWGRSLAHPTGNTPSTTPPATSRSGAAWLHRGLAPTAISRAFEILEANLRLSQPVSEMRGAAGKSVDSTEPSAVTATSWPARWRCSGC